MTTIDIEFGAIYTGKVAFKQKVRTRELSENTEISESQDPAQNPPESTLRSPSDLMPPDSRSDLPAQTSQTRDLGVRNDLLGYYPGHLQNPQFSLNRESD